MKRLLLLLMLSAFVGAAFGAQVQTYSETMSTNSATTITQTLKVVGQIDTLVVRTPGLDANVTVVIDNTTTGKRLYTGTLTHTSGTMDNRFEVNNVATWAAPGTTIKFRIDKDAASTGTTFNSVVFLLE